MDLKNKKRPFAPPLPFLLAVIVSGFAASHALAQEPLPIQEIKVAFGGAGSFCQLVLDDGGVVSTAFGGSVLGTYGWELLGYEGRFARLRVWLSVNATRMEYKGREFSERARSGDLSFVKRVKISSLKYLSARGNTVMMEGNFSIFHEEEVLLDPATNMLVDSAGEPWGRFLLWINPARVPFSGSIREVAIVRWLGNETLEWNVSRETLPEPIDVPGLVASRVIQATAEIGFEHPVAGAYISSLDAVYDEGTGAFLGAPAAYADDFLTQKAGVVLLLCVNLGGEGQQRTFGIRAIEVVSQPQVERTSTYLDPWLLRQAALAAIAVIAAICLLLAAGRSMRIG